VKQLTANSLIPFACSLASIAFVLPLTLFAISSGLSLRSFSSPQQSALGYLTQALAIAILVALPALLALRPIFRWHWAAVAIVAASAGFFLSLRALPHLRAFGLVTSASAWVFFLVALGLMVISALLAPATRTALLRRRWVVLSGEAVAYLCLTSVAVVFTSVALYVE
jgi:hypothetical protein